MNLLEKFYRNHFNAKGEYLQWEDLTDEQKRQLKNSYEFNSWKINRAIKELGAEGTKVLKPIIEAMKKIMT